MYATLSLEERQNKKKTSNKSVTINASGHTIPCLTSKRRIFVCAMNKIERNLDPFSSGKFCKPVILAEISLMAGLGPLQIRRDAKLKVKWNGIHFTGEREHEFRGL